MRRLSRWAARLYPRAWRDRYGPEFDALLEDVKPGVGDVVNVARGGVKMRLSHRAVTIVGAMALLGVLVGAVAPLTRPAEYLSIGSLRCVAPDPASEVAMDRAIQQMAQKVMSTDLGKMRRNVVIGGGRRVSPGVNSFAVGFRDTDPSKARKVALDVMRAMIEANFELGKSGNSRASIKVLDPPSLPTSPYNRNFRNTAIAGGMLGMLAGLIVAIGVAVRNRSMVKHA